MRYNDDGIIKIDKKFFQPCNGIEIQVVRWLVKKQDIGISK